MQKGERREEMYVARKTAMMSQIDAAIAVGISQAQYSYIENGYADPTPGVARTLIDMFKLPEDYFDKEVEANG